MGDKIVDVAANTFDPAVADRGSAANTCDPVVADRGSAACVLNFDKTPLSESRKEDVAAEQVHGTPESIDENSASNDTQVSNSEQEQTLPILKKVADLSNKIQNLKKEHRILSDKVKGITSDPSLFPEVFNTLQLLGTENELLKKKFIEECTERKRLYNEVIELKGNIRVFCRCRPLNQTEIANGSTSIIEFGPSQDNELQVVCSDSSKKHFKFDHVFRPDDNQEVVFGETKPIVTSVLDGYNVCIFAYGQTGTGKTFTMEGTPENRGVNYRALEELFRVTSERSGYMRYELYVSMLEVYNEKIRDLLAESSNQPAKKLEIKQAAEGTQEVPGLLEAPVNGTNEVWELLKSGSKVRSVGSTGANELSSRSHCLLRVTVKGDNLVNGQKTRSHLWLVDLAGSERVGRIDVDGERLKESQFINRSLSALGDVISALASKTPHIPYRNSKLTHMLQSSLGGDCKTVMFVQISPCATDLGETLCSLNFATRVRGVESGPARKQADISEIFRYKQMAEKLKHDEKETRKLQDNFQSLQLRHAAREQYCKSLQEKVRDLENQLAEERKIRLKQETRALTVAADQSSLKQAAKKIDAKEKPPAGPLKPRLALGRISNLIPPSLAPSQSLNTPSVGKENNSTTAATTRVARRISVAVRAPPPASQIQPRRRVSIATLRPEHNYYPTAPLQTSSLSTNKNGGVPGRQAFAKDARKARYSRLFSPMPGLAAETTTSPTGMRSSSSKFMGSPPAASWKPKHPTIVALQRKPVLWSPLRGAVRNKRKSIM